MHIRRPHLLDLLDRDRSVFPCRYNKLHVFITTTLTITILIIITTTLLQQTLET